MLDAACCLFIAYHDERALRPNFHFLLISSFHPSRTSLHPEYLVYSQSVSDSQALRSLSPDARAASPRKRLSVWCGTCAKRMFHTTHSIRRAPQALASNRDGNQTCSHQSLLGKGRSCEDTSRSGRGFPCTPFPIQVIDGATNYG